MTNTPTASEILVYVESECSRCVHELMDKTEAQNVLLQVQLEHSDSTYTSISEAVGVLVIREWAGTYFDERIKQFLLTCKVSVHHFADRR